MVYKQLRTSVIRQVMSAKKAGCPDWAIAFCEEKLRHAALRYDDIPKRGYTLEDMGFWMRGVAEQLFQADDVARAFILANHLQA